MEALLEYKCPYCGNPVVMQAQFSGALKPDRVIPFKLDKEAAIAALKKHYTGKRLLPKVFKDENHLKEIRGIYVPVWLFDAEASADVRFKATQVRAWSDSRYDYTQTSYFALSRSGNVAFSHIPVDGSTKMDDTLMESLEPYDHSQAVDFRTAYLAGYLADKYDVDDMHLYTHLDRREKAQSNSGSSTHTSSSGTTHGGGGGKF